MAAERAPDVEQLVRELLRAYQTGDVETISRHTSNDPAAILVGSDAREVARGHDDMVAMIRGDIDQQRSESPRWSPDEIEAYREGDVAWATMLGPYSIGDTAIPARALGVFRHEDGDLKVVAWVFSFAVPNEALEPGSAVLERLAAMAPH